jgi:hypothetical protein
LNSDIDPALAAGFFFVSEAAIPATFSRLPRCNRKAFALLTPHDAAFGVTGREIRQDGAPAQGFA